MEDRYKSFHDRADAFDRKAREKESRVAALVPEIVAVLREFVDDNGKLTTAQLQARAEAILAKIEGKQ